MIRSVFVVLVGWTATLVGAIVIVLARMMGKPALPGGIYDQVVRTWARVIVGAAGVTVVVHGEENLPPGGAVVICNHVSWFDVFSVASQLERCSFVAKSELRDFPVFGWGAAAAGIVFLDRDNRKAAFESYKIAAAEVQRGRRVIVFPEGTRGLDYHLRQFKKGPFVLAVSAQEPVVPTVIYGAREVMGKASFRVRSGPVHVHYLPSFTTAGRTYEDRSAIMAETHARMDDFLEREYGVRRASLAKATS